MLSAWMNSEYAGKVFLDEFNSRLRTLGTTFLVEGKIILAIHSAGKQRLECSTVNPLKVGTIISRGTDGFQFSVTARLPDTVKRNKIVHLNYSVEPA